MVILHHVGDFVGYFQFLLTNHVRLHDNFNVTTEVRVPFFFINQAEFDITVLAQESMDVVGQIQHTLALYLRWMGGQDRNDI